MLINLKQMQNSNQKNLKDKGLMQGKTPLVNIKSISCVSAYIWHINANPVNLGGFVC